MTSKMQLNGRSHCFLVAQQEQKRLERMSEQLTVRQVRLSEIRQQIVPDAKFSCTAPTVAEVGARLIDE